MANGINPNIFFQGRRATGGASLARGFRQGFNIANQFQNQALARQMLKIQAVERERNNDFRSAGRLLEFANNKNNPENLRLQSTNAYIQLHNKHNPKSPLSPVTEIDLRDKKRKSILDNVISKNLGLIKDAQKSLKAGTPLRQVRSNFNLLQTQNNLEAARSLNFETDQVIDVQDISRLSAQALPPIQKPQSFTLGPGQRRFQQQGPGQPTKQIATVPPAPPRQRQFSPLQLEQARILTIPLDERTDEEKKILGSFIAPPRQRQFSPLQSEQARILTIPSDERTDEEKKILGSFIAGTRQKEADVLKLRQRLSQIAKDKERLSRGGVTDELRKVLGAQNAELLNALKGGAKDPVAVAAAMRVLEQEETEINSILQANQAAPTITPPANVPQFTGDEEFDTFFEGQ